ncbi:MAG: TadE/TadG family type IV pilus assembly protein [Candidatus Nanopelagicales bacterium]
MELHESRGDLAQDEGVIAVTTALIAVILIVAVAFALDTGRWYVEGQRLQRTVDAAALAGAPYLPGDLAKARTEARQLIDRNGYDSSAGAVPDSNIVIGDRPSRLQVTMSNTIPNLFATVIGINTQTLTRTATADYAAAAAMGSPCNVMGNEPPATAADDSVASEACPDEPNFWQNVAGPDAPKGNGDRYTTRKCSSSSNSNCDSASNNLDYSGGSGIIGQSYYVYKITAKSSVPMTIQLFDPMFVDVGDQCERGSRLKKTTDGFWDLADHPNPYVYDAKQRYAWGNKTTSPATPGTFCTGDILFDDGGTAAERATKAAKLNTTFALLAPTETLDPLQSSVICKKDFGGYSGDLTKALVGNTGDSAPYNDTVAQNFRRWQDLCTVATPQVGRDYYLLVRTNIPSGASDTRVLDPAQDSGVGGNGHNRYGIRVNAGVLSDQIAISALERMPIYANLKSGTTDFHLARVASGNAGNLLKITFFDTGDASGEAVIAIKNPAGNAPSGCKATGEVRTSPTGDFDEATCTLSRVYSGNGYNGKIQRIEVPIPDTYTCNDADPTACWYRLKFTYPPGVTANDTTTWSASLDGDPVRLVK